MMSCSKCICDTCLYWWSGRCPYGGCYDDHRAETDPYDKTHPDEPPRKSWSYWDHPGEQAYWCRGGLFYPVSACDRYVRHEEDKHFVKECFGANVSVFQDGYIDCCLAEDYGCKRCMEEWEEKHG